MLLLLIFKTRDENVNGIEHEADSEAALVTDDCKTKASSTVSSASN